jgi:solute carrier family 25 carnitine/acylcarnitine transporter 20/29
MLAPLFTIAISRGLTFQVYQQAKYAMDDRIYDLTGESPLQRVNTSGTTANLSTITCFSVAGAIAGGVSVLFSCEL